MIDIFITSNTNEGKTTIGILIHKALTEAGFQVALNDADIKITPGHKVILKNIPLLSEKIETIVKKNSIININTVAIKRDKMNLYKDAEFWIRTDGLITPQED
jgi:hypothetical protein